MEVGSVLFQALYIGWKTSLLPDKLRHGTSKMENKFGLDSTVFLVCVEFCDPMYCESSNYVY